eukprot:TRINITY_DN15613_c0_g1_i1.p1 TRINITY_DN15613_c0_g1~~TRINITY_DN15613_c0_g1_i1.p1  ORF type:complete len:174 (-),score=36.66 TRINITY_DN15613_c0_g1_i1:206-727(-)
MTTMHSENTNWWQRVVYSMPALSESDKDVIVNLGTPIIMLAAFIFLASIALIVFGTMCHLDQFCWYYDGSSMFIIFGLVLLAPTLLACSMIAYGYGKSVLEERRYKHLIAAAVQRRQDQAAERRQVGFSVGPSPASPSSPATSPLFGGSNNDDYSPTPKGDSLSHLEIQPGDL